MINGAEEEVQYSAMQEAFRLAPAKLYHSMNRIQIPNESPLRLMPIQSPQLWKNYRLRYRRHRFGC